MKRNIVIIDEELPYPLDNGKRLRIYNLIRILAQKYHIHILAHERTSTIDDYSISALKAIGVDCTLVSRPRGVLPFFPEGVQRIWRVLLNLMSPFPFSAQYEYTRTMKYAIREYASSHQVDYWQCEWAPYARYFQDFGSNVNWIFIAHDRQHITWQRHAKVETNLILRVLKNIQANKYLSFERRIFRQAAKLIVVSEIDREGIMELTGRRDISVVENGVDASLYAGGKVVGSLDNLAFIGNLAWSPNIDAALTIVKDIAPELQNTHPGIRIRIVGREPPKILEEMIAACHNVELHSNVKDIVPFYEQSGILLVPLTVGSGSRLKILEAFAAGTLVISSWIGAEGLEVEPGKHYLRAESPGEFVEQISYAVNSPADVDRIKAAARELVKRRYDWKIIARKLDSIWSETT